MLKQNALSFNENGKLRIMVVSDPQDLKYVRPGMVRMLNRAYDEYKPGLVLFNGDNILGNHLLDARFGSRKVGEGREDTERAMRKALEKILIPVNAGRIPFAMVYGNHDDMNELSKDEQIAIYREYMYCLPMNTGDSSVDCDTYVIKLYSAENELCFAVYMLDSAWTDEDGGHAEIKPGTVQWFRKKAAALREEAGKPVPAVMLFHIPPRASLGVMEECDGKTPGAIRCDDGVYRRLDTRVARGFLHEPPSLLTTDSGLFDAVVEDGSVKAIINGHDHSNCFEGTYRGVRFLQCGAASFRCYGGRETKGVRILDIDKSGSFTTEFITYDDLCGKDFAANVRYFWDADEYAVAKYTSLGIATLLGAAGAVYGAVKRISKK